MRTIRQLLTAVAAMTLLGCIATPPANQHRHNYVIVAVSEVEKNVFRPQLVTVQGDAAHIIADIPPFTVFTLYGTNGNEAGIISPVSGSGDMVSIVDLHDLNHVSKIPIVGARTVSIH